MSVLTTQTATPEPIRVHVRSETDRLKTVVMRWADPFPLSLNMIVSLLDASVREQVRHNTWKHYRYQKVREQQQCLVQILRDHGVSVRFLSDCPGVGTQHYTRDIAFCIDDAFFMARMGTGYRLPEQRALLDLLPRLSKVVYLERGRIEGGDVMLHGDTVLVGLGEATDREGVDALRRKLVELGNPRKVVAIPFAHRGVIHLDTKFNIVDRNIALFARKSFQSETVRWLEQHFDLIEATDEEVSGVEINTLTIGGGRVIVQEQSERLAKLIQHRGLTPIPVDYSEVIHLPGSFRCTTLPLERIPDTHHERAVKTGQDSV